MCGQNQCLKSSSLEKEQRIGNARLCFCFIPIGTYWYKQNINCAQIECDKIHWLLKSVDMLVPWCKKIFFLGWDLVPFEWCFKKFKDYWEKLVEDTLISNRPDPEANSV